MLLIYILSLNSSAVGVPFQIPSLEVLKMPYRYIRIKTVYSWGTSRKEVIVLDLTEIKALLFFSILYIEKESLVTSDVFKLI